MNNFLKFLLNGFFYISIAMAFPMAEQENAEMCHNISDYYFSDKIMPLHYDIHISFVASHLGGESKVTFYLNRPTSHIILNMGMNIDIIEIKLISVKSKLIHRIHDSTRIICRNHNIKEKILIIKPRNQLMSEKYLECGVYILYFGFSYLMSHDARDFLQTWYTEEKKDNGFTSAILIQPKSAQQLFPCWDEPTLRATFNISIQHHKELNVLSNMPIQEYKSVDDFTMYTVFQTTPPISIYNVAIIMSGLDQVLNSTETVVNIWCRPHLKSHMTFAQYVAGNVTEYLGNNFKILKEIPKVDYVAIPSLNKRIEKTWGLIFYNEADIIYNEELHPASYKITVMRSVTRDIIYQWFGNLFTPFCLSFHRLLNEGLITFLETHIIKKVYPDFENITDLLVVETQHEALHINSYSAMNSFATNTSSISEICSHFPFSRIIGPAIWRMLNGTLPRNSLLMGLDTYFNTRFPNFNSPTPDDLWSFIQTGIDGKLKNKLYNLSIKQIMDIWITQTYCPVVNVKRDYSNNLIKISKEINDKLDRKPYFIPVSYVKETNINFVNISLQSFNCLTQSNPEMEINYDSKDKWFIANILQTGYYRVNYDTENWRMIASYLKSKKYENIHVINRAQIIDDAFHLAMEKKLDFSIFWELASYLKQEKDYVAWYPMIKVFERISSVFAFTTTHDEHLKELKIKIGSLFEKAENDMYNQTETNITNNVLNKYLKQELTKWGCLINNPLCMQMAKEQFEWHLSDPETRKLLPGWKKLISCNGLRTANYSVWFSAWTNALNVYEEKSDYEMLKFSSSCSDHPRKYLHLLFIQRSSQTMIIDFETSTRKKEHSYALIADIYLSMLAMQAKNPTLLKDILDLPNLNSIKNSRISTIATLIVIINNVYSKNELDMITKFAKDMPQLVSESIERKIRTRLLEIESQIKFYQTIIKLSSSHLSMMQSTITRPTTPPTIILRNETFNNPRLRFMG